MIQKICSTFKSKSGIEREIFNKVKPNCLAILYSEDKCIAMS